MNTLKALAVVVSVMLSSYVYAAEVASDKAPILLKYTVQASKAMGLKELRVESFPNGVREVRIWVGFGLVSPEMMVRLYYRNQAYVSGEVFLHYSAEWKRSKETDERQFYRELVSYCEPMSEVDEVEACRLKQPTIEYWGDFYRKLERLELWSLPDEGQLPSSEIGVLDGVAMVVELRDGEMYRAYSYGNPGFNPHPKARRASEILGLVMRLY